MHLRSSCTLLAVLGALLMAQACGDETTPPTTPRAGAEPQANTASAPAQLVLLDAEPAAAPRTLRVRVVAAADGGAATVARELCDPFLARLDGWQRNDLADAATAAGSSAPDLGVVEVTFPSSGHALLALSTKPRIVRWHDAGGARDVKLRQHVKHVCAVRDPAPVVGEAGGAPSPAVTAAVGFDVELVPLVDPLRLQAGDELPLRLKGAGDGAVLRVRRRAALGARTAEASPRTEPGQRQPLDEQMADVPCRDGTALVPLPSAGAYVLSLVDGSHARDVVHVAALTFTIGAVR